MSTIKEDINFLLTLVQDWDKEIPKGLSPEFYTTLSYDGDIEIQNRIKKIKDKHQKEKCSFCDKELPEAKLLFTDENRGHYICVHCVLQFFKKSADIFIEVEKNKSVTK